MKHPNVISLQLTDEPTARVVRSVSTAISALQRMDAAELTVISDVVLVDNVITPVAHGLGRIPKFVGPSTIRNASTAGIIVEYRDGTYDRTKYVALKAVFYGATITVDLVVL